MLYGIAANSGQSQHVRKKNSTDLRGEREFFQTHVDREWYETH